MSAPEARLSDTPLPPLDTVSPRWPGRYVAVGGAQVYVRSTPAPAGAEPAFCVHGLGGSSTNWTDLAGQLADRLAVEAIDLPGFGLAGPAAHEDYRLTAHAATVIGYLEQSERGPVHLIANSMGGAVSIIVAAQRPDLVRTLSLISPAVPDVRRLRAHPLRSDPRVAALVVPGLGGYAMRKASAIPVESRVRASFALCFADPSRCSPTRLEQTVEDARTLSGKSWANRGFLRSLRGLARSQFLQPARGWATMRSVAVPTLVLWGDADRLVAPDLAGPVAEAIPHARLLVLPDIGHTAMMEDPVTTARAVLALVEDAPVPQP